ncbi:glycosyltransferase [Tateyamaria sp. ANG-S1]|uniref:rhamnosyltransferase WsaF family glycosyltransferase n=1 Tax=Tateyamaria sp. ANG-S1 TaxID=1577905 RepID=UPI000AE0B263|nr:glycosyltransferase [Tateyamaria sp. ANG-S1]
MFDPIFYRLVYKLPDTLTDADLQDHFEQTGWRQYLDPNPFFNVSAYLMTAKDIAEQGINPYAHYLGAGHMEGRRTSLSQWNDPSARLHTDEEFALLKEAVLPDYIKQQRPDLNELSDDALRAWYLVVGWRENIDPNPEFSTNGYLSLHQDVRDAAINPLLNFLQVGAAEGREVISTQAQRQAEQDVLAALSARLAPRFDHAFYRAQDADLEGLDDEETVRHYLKSGWLSGLDPSPDFSTNGYLELNPDVRDRKGNPFVHLIMFGEAEGRESIPSNRTDIIVFDQSTALPVENVEEEVPERTGNIDTENHHSSSPEERADAAAIRRFFDFAWYRQTYPQFSDSDEQAILYDYLENGWREDRDPSPAFSSKFYKENYQDISSNDINPLLHYALFGMAEGRHATPPAAAATPPSVAEQDLAAVRDSFNAAWYRKIYKIEGSDEEQLIHYMTNGWKEGHDPCPEFSTSHYLATYSDIAAGGSNPFLHYVLFGKNEGRQSRPDNIAVEFLFDPDANLVPNYPEVLTGGLISSGAVAPDVSDRSCLDIHWLIPDFAAGGGGHMTIFRMVRYLENFGHRCTIWIEQPRIHDSADAAWEDIVKYFQCVEANVRFVRDGFYETSGDIVIATGWSTAWIAQAAEGFAACMYFVQDHEPEFYPTGANGKLARETYGFDLGCICASPWLEELMKTRYNRWAKGFYLALEQEQYGIHDAKAHKKRFNKRISGKFKIAVYGRQHTDRRCVPLALAALQILARRRQDFEVHFFGQDKMPFSETPFIAYNHGVLGSEKLAELYNDAHLGMCFSGTNYSLVPKEMMSCGLPLLELDGESTRAIFPEGVVALAGPHPADIADRIEALMQDPATRKAQSKAALNWVGTFNWEKSAREVEAAILEYMAHKNLSLSAPAGQRVRETLMDVIIPTWNGREEFKPVLKALREQRLADQIQIHCIDSTSSDGTIEWLSKQKDVSLTVIDQKDFQHGRTRNDGIALGQAPIAAILTQDAQPVGRAWATDILKMFNAVPEAAGLFGRHIAYPDHPRFVREEIANHFAHMQQFPLVLSKDTDRDLWESGDVGWRQMLHFYSDNNSAMRRAVWEDIPYPEVDYGEDQVWARDIIEAGFSKIYAPTAAVYHSHDYDPEQTYKRSFTEGAFFYEHFGYELGTGTEEQIAECVACEQRDLAIWGSRNNVSEAEIQMRQKNVAAKYRGWRDGLNSVFETA